MPFPFYKFKTSRYVSFTFDDGLINSANKIDQIITPHKATFYIVTGWLRSSQFKIEDPPNIDFDHGDYDDWEKISDLGHEIGSHTLSHIDPTSQEAQGEYQESLELIKQFSLGPYSLAMPRGLKPLSRPPYDSVRLCDGKKIHNSLKKIDFFNLISWDPVEVKLPTEQALKKIKQLPSNSWLILRGHGLDDEGYCPWPSDYLKKIIEFLQAEEIQIKTVAEMTLKFKKD